MRLHRRQPTVAVALVAAIVLCGFMASASAAPTVKITNCLKASVRPRTLTLACGDGNAVLKELRWSSFGGATARARGELAVNRCVPNCAAGRTVNYPVSVKATDVRTCKSGLRVYDRVTLQFAGRAAASARDLRRWVLGCPA
jgi:hypothetical protein